MTAPSDQEIPKATTLRRLMPYFQPYLGRLGLAGLTLLVVTGVHLARPLILREIIDKAIPSGDTNQAIRWAGLFVGSLVIGAMAMYARILIMAQLGAEILASIKQQVFDHVLHQGMRFFDRHKVGQLINRTESDVNQLKSLFTHSAAQIFQSILLIIGIILLIVREAPWMGVLAIVSMLVIGFGLTWYVDYVRAVWKKARELNSDLTGYLAEYVQGVPLIQLHNRQEAIQGNLARLNNEKASWERWGCFVEYVLFMPVFRFFTEIGVLVVIIFYGSREILAGRMSLGTLIMFIELMRRFFRPLEALIEIVAQIQAALAAASRVFDVLDTPTDIIDNGTRECPGIRQQLTFDNLTFAYEDEDVLKNVSFSVAQGEHVALVGASGSGKTTTISLMMRFYDPQQGSIRVDGIDIRDFPLTAWRDEIALVLQDIYLFPGTIMDNLKAFSPDVDAEAVIKASKEIGAHDFIVRLPQGYDTPLAERGANLSQGERQLLSYTRALIKDPQLLILDEATSSVDVITERMLQKSMEKLMQGRTAVIIAHRLSTIRHADKILVFEEGLLKERGSHQELLDLGGIYRELVKIQSVYTEGKNSPEAGMSDPLLPGSTPA